MASAEVVGRIRETVVAWSDPLARHGRRIGRAQARARVASVGAAVTTGASAVLVPWHGIGAPDAFWVAATAGTMTAAAFAWQRVRRLVHAPPPVPRPSRTSTARPAMQRLAGARRALGAVLSSLGPLAGDTAQEAAAGQRALSDLARRISAVEAALGACPPDAVPGLVEARTVLLGTLDEGVVAYEQLVAAAAGCVAMAARGDRAAFATQRLAEAGDRLRGLTAGLAELAG